MARATISSPLAAVGGRRRALVACAVLLAALTAPVHPAAARPADAVAAARACTITGTAGADTLTGTPRADRLCGRAGADSIRGGRGADTLVGGGGGDLLQGKSGADQLRGDGGDDVLYGGAGPDRLRGGAGSDRLGGGFGADDLSGGPGRDIVFYGQRSGAVRVSIGTGANDGVAGERDNVRGDVEDVRGGGGNDVLIGNGAANELFGGGGRDRLVGKGGSDVLMGGGGNDRLDARDGASSAARAAAGAVDRVVCGGGEDTALVDPADIVDPGCEHVHVAGGPQNHAPTGLTLSPSSVAENESVGAAVGTLSASDPDPGDSASFALVPGAGSTDNGSFQIVGSTLKTRKVFDYETKHSYSVRIRATDHGTPAGQIVRAFTITVTNVNEAPAGLTLSNATVPENKVNEPVGDFSVSDEDVGQSHTFELVAGAGSADNGKFAIVGPTLKTAQALDFESQPPGGYSIRVRATDGGTPPLSVVKEFTITATDSDEPPVAHGKSTSTPEDTPVTVTLSASDPEGADITEFVTSAESHGTLGAVGPITCAGIPKTCIADVHFTPNPNYNGPAGFSYTAKDASHTSDAADVSISVTAVNDDPQADDQSVTTAEDTAKTITLSASDVDADPLAFSIVSGPSSGSLGAIGTPVCGLTPNVCTAEVVYTPAANTNGSDSFQFKVNDGTVGSAPATVSVMVDAVDDAPELQGIEAGPLAYSENDPATAVTVSTTVTDVDSANFDTGTLTVDYATGGTADDRLEIVNAGQIATSGSTVTRGGTPIGTFTGGTGTTPLVVTLNANATPAFTTELVQAVAYRNVSEAPSTATRAARFVLTDGDGGTSTAATRAIELTDVNDAPVNTVPAGPVAAPLNTDTPITDISIADVDAADDPVQVDLSVSNGTLTVSQSVPFGLIVGDVAGNGTSHVVVTASLAKINKTLADKTVGLVYNGAVGGSDPVTVHTDDKQHNGAGGAKSDTDTIPLVVDSPPVASGQFVTTNEDTDKTITLSASDPDGDTLTFAITGGTTHGVLLGPISAPSCAANVCTADITYRPDPNYNGPDEFTFTATDPSNLTSAEATVSITVNPVNDAPQLTGIESGALAYTENEPATPVTSTTVVNDIDSPNFDTGTLTVDYSVGGTVDDRLEIRNEGTGAGQIGVAGSTVSFGGTDIGAFTGGSGTTPLVVTLNANATPTAAQSLVRNVTYRNVSDAPSSAARTVRFVLTDGDGGTSAPAARAITLTAVNDAPTLAGIEGAAVGYVESVDSPPSQSQVTNSITVADVDNANLAGATVSITGGCQTGEDSLVFTNQNGITGVYTPATCTLALTGSSSVANYLAALRSIKYQDSSDTPNTTTRAVTFQVDDGQSSDHASNTQTRDITVTASNDSPSGVADTFNGTNSALAGVTLAVSTSPSTPNVAVTGNLLSNDTDPDTPHASLTASAGISSAQGGVVAVNSDATFSYTPAPGFTGTDTFAYTVHDNGSPDRTGTATVTINVAGPRVWFVNPGAGAGNGTSASPLNSLAPLSSGGGSDGLDGTGDVIFVYQGSGTAASAGFVLEGSQRLVGQPQGLSVTNANGTYNLVAAGGANPAITNGSGAGLTLADGNTIQRVNVTGSSDVGVSGNAVSTLTYGPNTTISGNSGGGLALSGAAGGAISVGADISTSAGHSVSIANRTSGTTSLTGAINDTGTGISLTGNTGATINSTGAVTASTGASAAFNATGGGTVNVTGANNTLATTTGTALNVASTTIGASGLTFKSISANGATNGIVLNSTGSSGGLTVSGAGSTGQGGDASGGTIQNTTGAGVSLNGTRGPSLNNMTIANTAGGAGISGTGVTNFSFTNGTVTNSGFNSSNVTVCASAPATAHCPFDSNIAFNSNGATIDNVDGAVTVTNSVLSRAYQFGVDILDNSGTISNLNISNNAITSPTTAADSAGSGLRVQALGSTSGVASITKGTLNGNTIQNFPNGAGIVVQGGNTDSAAAPGGSFGTGTGANAVQIDNNLIHGQSAANPMSTNCILVTMPGHGSGFVDVSSNGTVGTPLGDNRGNCVSINATGAYILTATVNSNVVSPGTGQNDGAFGIAGGTDKQVLADTTTADSAVMNLTANSNTVSDSKNSGIRFLANSTGTLNAKIQNNNVGTPDTGASGPSEPGIRVDSGTSVGTAVDTDVCLNISGNTTAGSTFSPTTFPGIGLRKQGTVATTNDFGIVGLNPSPATAAQTESYVSTQNPASTSGTFGTGGAAVISGSNFVNCALGF